MSVSREDAWDLADQVGHLYSVFLNITEEQLHAECLSVAEFVALAILTRFQEGLSQTQWGLTQGVSRQRAHVLTRRLQKEGFIDVTRIGRSSKVTLSTSGSAFVTRLQKPLSTKIAAQMQGLSDVEAALFSQLLDKALSP